jgi:hypothetical protein
MPLFAAFLAAQAASAPAADGADPLSLFRSVCLADQVRLAEKDFAGQRYSKLPQAVRVALNQTVPGFLSSRTRQMMQPLPASEVPNRILARMPKRKKVFLILPVPGRAGAAAGTCGVAWKGEDFDRARDMMLADFKVPPVAAVPLSGTPIKYLRSAINGADVAAAEYFGWTVFSVTPDVSTAQE